MADNIWVNITDLLWPVGSTYFCWSYSSDPSDLGNENPVNYFGGTWIGPIGPTSEVHDGLVYYQYKFYRSA